MRFCSLAGDPRFLATSDRSGQTLPLICNARTGERAELQLDALDGDVIPLDWSEDGQTLLLCHQARTQERLYRYDLGAHHLHALAHPSGSVTSRLNDPGDPSRSWGDSRSTCNGRMACSRRKCWPSTPRRASRPAASCGSGEETTGHAWQSVEFASSDGVLVQGWLGLPGGSERATDPVPTIIYLHGGPFAVQRDWYLLPAETWVDSGFAFLALNYRGSTTFGREFERAIMGDAGHWELEDMAAAHQWLRRPCHRTSGPDPLARALLWRLPHAARAGQTA